MEEHTQLILYTTLKSFLLFQLGKLMHLRKFDLTRNPQKIRNRHNQDLPGPSNPFSENGQRAGSQPESFASGYRFLIALLHARRLSISNGPCPKWLFPSKLSWPAPHRLAQLGMFQCSRCGEKAWDAKYAFDLQVAGQAPWCPDFSFVKDLVYLSTSVVWLERWRAPVLPRALRSGALGRHNQAMKPVVSRSQNPNTGVVLVFEVSSLSMLVSGKVFVFSFESELGNWV